MDSDTHAPGEEVPASDVPAADPFGLDGGESPDTGAALLDRLTAESPAPEPVPDDAAPGETDLPEMEAEEAPSEPLEVDRLRERIRELERQNGRLSGELGYLKQKGRGPAGLPPPPVEMRPDAVPLQEADANDVVAEEARLFMSEHPDFAQHPPAVLQRVMAPYARELAAAQRTGSAAFMAATAARVLREAHQAIRDEAARRERRAEQFGRQREMKLSLANSGAVGGPASPPTSQPKDLDSMSVQELEAELQRLTRK